MTTTENTEDTEEKRLLVQLVAGLLASGHYTLPDNGYGSPDLKSYECDWEDWREAGYYSSHPFHVIEDAEALLFAIEFITKKEGAK